MTRIRDKALWVLLVLVAISCLEVDLSSETSLFKDFASKLASSLPTNNDSYLRIHDLSKIELPTPMVIRAAFEEWPKTMDTNIRYQLVRGDRYNVNAGTYPCRDKISGKPLDHRVELPSSNPFDFYTFIQTDLNILVMGDSLAVEFGTWFQNAGRAKNKTNIEGIDWKRYIAEGLVFADVDGGGTISYWRNLGFWLRRNHGLPLPNYGRGWTESWVTTLHSKLPTSSDKVHVLIFRVSHPWLSMNDVTEESLRETIAVAQDYLGEPLTIIFMTVPINNNIVTQQDFEDFRAMNNRIRSFVTKLRSSDVLVSDLEVYMDNIIKWNAKQIGMNTSYPSCFLAERLVMRRNAHHVAQVCGERVPINSTSCRKNILLNDGLHFCTETLGPRLFANWACLLQCIERSSQAIRECERACNEVYFTLNDTLPAGGI